LITVICMGVGVLVGGAGGGGLAVAVDLLDRALDAMAAVPVAQLPLADQADAAAVMVRLRARFDAVDAVVVRAFDTGGEWALDGHRSAAAALAHRCRLPRAEARRRVRLARRLEAVPAVAAALAGGQITTQAAEVLLAARRPDVAAEFDRDIHVLVGHARTLSHAGFTKAVRYWSDRVDPDGAGRRAESIDQQRRAFISRTLDDLIRIDAWLPPVAGTAVLTAVERIEDELFRADWDDAESIHGSNTTTAHLARTAAQRRADALIELAVRATATPGDARRPLPLVNILMDAATFDHALRRRADLPTPAAAAAVSVQCELLDGTVLTPAQGIEAALAGHVRRVVYATPNLITGLSPRRRLYTGALRHLLEIRDRTCTHPGCDQPAWRCDADHIQPWNGTNTTQHNGRLLCRYHHRLRQRLANPVTATRRPDGTLAHHRSDGTPITGPPRTHGGPGG
jgi:hypothetical protein